MAMTQDQLNQRVQLAKQQGWSDARIQNALRNTAGQQQAAPAPKKANLIAQLAPLLGSVGGGVVGGLTAGPFGVIAGGAAGGAAGEKYRQKAMGEQQNIGGIVREGAFGALGGIGEGIQALRGVGTAAKLAEGAIDAGRAAKGIRAAEEVGQAARSAGLVEKGIATVGKSATKAGESFAVKALRPSPSQLAGFAAKHGEDIVPVLQREGLVGKGAEQIQARLEPLQQHFNDMISQTKVAVKPGQLEKTFADHMKPLLESTDPQDARVVQNIQENLKNIIAKIEKDPSVANLNKIRQQYDAKVNYKLAAQDIVSYGEKKTIANALRSTVQQAVDSAGMKGPVGESLKELGSRLNKLYDISSIAESKAHLGRGNLPAGLLQTLGFGGGGLALGGPVGGLATVAAQAAVNSPAGMRLSSQALTGLGKGLAKAAPAIGPSIGRAANIGGLQIGANAVFGNGQPQQEQIQSQGPERLQGQYQSSQSQAPQIQQQPDQSQQQQQMFLMAMMEDMQKTGGKNLAKIQAIAQFAGKMNPQAKQTKLSDTAIKTVSDLRTAMQGLGELSGQLGGSTGIDIPGIGYRATLPSAQTKITQAKIDRVKQFVGKALEGGVLRKEDEAKYAKILPTIHDTADVAQAKIDSIMQALQQQLDSYTSLQNSRGSGQFSTDPYSSLVSGLNSTLSGY